jgi:hypothetical protein
MNRPRYTPKQLAAAVRQSSSIRQVLVRLGLAPYGGNYQSVRMACTRLSLDTSHFVGRGWSRNKVLGPREPISAVLRTDSAIQSFGQTSRSLWSSITLTATEPTTGFRTCVCSARIVMRSHRRTGASDVRGLARDCSRHNAVCFPEFDPIRAGVSDPRAQPFKSLASTNFATRATGSAGILAARSANHRMEFA